MESAALSEQTAATMIKQSGWWQYFARVIITFGLLAFPMAVGSHSLSDTVDWQTSLVAEGVSVGHLPDRIQADVASTRMLAGAGMIMFFGLLWCVLSFRRPKQFANLLPLAAAVVLGLALTGTFLLVAQLGMQPGLQPMLVAGAGLVSAVLHRHTYVTKLVRQHALEEDE